MEDSGTVRPGTEGLTTPGPVQISRWLREMADDGVSHAALEASSHALAQYRLDGIRFDVAVFTNLSQDHLDYHADLEDYRSAKSRILEPSEARRVGGGEPGRGCLGVPGHSS